MTAQTLRRPRAVALALLALALAPACRAAEEAPTLPTGAEHLLGPELLPTPFSAAQIRAANPPGTTRTYLQSAGGAAQLQRSTFLEHPDGLARFEQIAWSLGATPEGEPRRVDATWEELQSHASYPRDETRVVDTTCTTAAGTFDVWLYEHVPAGEDAADGEVRRFYFAKERPGPPVLFTVHAGGELAYYLELVRARYP